METITKKNTLSEKLITEFESTKNSLFGNLNLREEAANSFAKQGVPNRKHEEYKYVNIDLALKDEFSFSAKKGLTSQQIEPAKFLKDAIIIVIENGIFSQELPQLQDLPKGLIVSGLSEASKKHSAVFEKHYAKYSDVNADPFAALNTATNLNKMCDGKADCVNGIDELTYICGNYKSAMKSINVAFMALTDPSQCKLSFL